MKKYPVEVILARADLLWIVDGEILADAPPGTLSDRFRQTIADHARELLAILPGRRKRDLWDMGRAKRAYAV